MKKTTLIALAAIALSYTPCQGAAYLTWADAADGWNSQVNPSKVVARDSNGSIMLSTLTNTHPTLQVVAGDNYPLVALALNDDAPAAFAGEELVYDSWVSDGNGGYSLHHSMLSNGGIRFYRGADAPYDLLLPDVPTSSAITSGKLMSEESIHHAIAQAANTISSYEPPILSTITINANTEVVDRVVTIQNTNNLPLTFTFTGLFEGARGTIIYQQGSSPVSISVPSNPGPYLGNWDTKIAIGSGTGTTLFTNNTSNGYTIIKWMYGSNSELFIKVDSTYN